jgi:hypothetical protein
MPQLIGLIVALIANLLLAPSPPGSSEPIGISGGGPVGIPQPHPPSSPRPTTGPDVTFAP